MLQSTIACPACRTIFNARAAAKVMTDPRKAEALNGLASKLDALHKLPSQPHVLIAEQFLIVLVEEAIIGAVAQTFGHLSLSDLDAKVDAIVADANAAHATEIARLDAQAMAPSKTDAKPAEPFNGIRFPQKGGAA